MRHHGGVSIGELYDVTLYRLHDPADAAERVLAHGIEEARAAAVAHLDREADALAGVTVHQEASGDEDEAALDRARRTIAQLRGLAQRVRTVPADDLRAGWKGLYGGRLLAHIAPGL
jgi:hypothetical protein